MRRKQTQEPATKPAVRDRPRTGSLNSNGSSLPERPESAAGKCPHGGAETIDDPGRCGICEDAGRSRQTPEPQETEMGAPSPELCNLWLARAFNAQDAEAPAAMYHPDASIVQVDKVHGGSRTARGADAIRETMAAYIGMKPH